MMSQVIQIQDQFDVAIARSVVRRKAAERDWMPLFRARAAAALTAMASLLLAQQMTGSLDIDVIDQAGRAGMALQCSFPWTDNRYTWLDEVRSRLGKVADELEIHDDGQGLVVTVRLWLPPNHLGGIK